MAAMVSAHATPQFQNPGNLTGWHLMTQDKGTVKIVPGTESDPSYKPGETQIACTQIFDPDYTNQDTTGKGKNRYHSELVHACATYGSTWYYGFAFRLMPGWEFDDQHYNIAQFNAGFRDPGVGYIPITMIWLKGNQLNTRTGEGVVPGRKTTPYENLATVTAGEWHRVELQVHWVNDTTGFFKFWYDGKLLLDKENLPTDYQSKNATQPKIDLRVGLYANGWHDDGHMVGTQGTRTIYYAHIGSGSTFPDADPASW